jgi:hypothetical protein
MDNPWASSENSVTGTSSKFSLRKSEQNAHQKFKEAQFNTP